MRLAVEGKQFKSTIRKLAEVIASAIQARTVQGGQCAPSRGAFRRWFGLLPQAGQGLCVVEENDFCEFLYQQGCSLRIYLHRDLGA